MQKFGIGWQIGGTTGWGVYGDALMQQGVRRGLLPIPVYVSQDSNLNPLEQRVLAPFQRQWYIEQQLFSLGGGRGAHAPYPFLMGLGNNLAPAASVSHISGAPEIGVVFFEHRNFEPSDVDIACNRFSKMIAGSSWNAEVLQDLGFPDVEFCPQGIDVTRFHPAPSSGILDDKFVIFSGGKLEFRKGQDIVIEAFRRFYKGHPDAVLMLAWHNHWEQSVNSVYMSPYGFGSPERMDDGETWKMTEWLMRQGLPASSVIDLGEVQHDQMPQLLREADIGVFPNRGEGGTNLVAMECMACGVPVILSDNTGHRDLLQNDGAALRLSIQGGVHSDRVDDPSLFDDWGESDPDEIVAHLEWVYNNRTAARDVGAVGAKMMQAWSWPKKIDQLLGCIGL